MKEKVYYPNTSGIGKIMGTVYAIVFFAGSAINIIRQDGLESWLVFLKVSLIYIGICTLIYLAIKSQRIILSEKQFTLKVFGFTRHQITLNQINEIRKAKLNGSPIMEIETLNKRAFPVPFLPFEKCWDELLPILKEKCGSEAIGEMKLRREKGELRSWDEA
jgi:hypothetical protein